MNVNVELEALSIVVDRLPEQAVSEGWTLEDIPVVVGHLERRLTLIKRHVATMEAIRFYNEVEAGLAALPVNRDANTP